MTASPKGEAVLRVYGSAIVKNRKEWYTGRKIDQFSGGIPMKSMFQKLHRTAWVAFTLMTILVVLYLFLFGALPSIMVLLWFVALALMVMVLIGCIVQNVSRHYQMGKLGKLVLRYAVVAAASFAVLVLLDWTTGEIAWAADAQAGLIIGLMGLYAKP